MTVILFWAVVLSIAGAYALGYTWPAQCVGWVIIVIIGILAILLLWPLAILAGIFLVCS